MTGNLYPTPHRLALLRDVAAGEIWQSSNRESWDSLHFKRTTSIAEAERAGWIELGEVESIGPMGYDGRRWRLTDAGRAVLDSHPEPHIEPCMYVNCPGHPCTCDREPQP